jgi:thiol-disulfide isomerase/thioredoxin
MKTLQSLLLVLLTTYNVGPTSAAGSLASADGATAKTAWTAPGNTIGAMLPCQAPASSLIVYEFTSKNCGPCCEMAPDIAALQQQGYPIQVVDIDAVPMAKSRFNVDRVPTLVAWDGHFEVSRLVGRQSRQTIVAMFGGQQRSQSQPANGGQGNGQLYVAPQEPVEPWADSRIVRIRNCVDDQRQMYAFLSGSQVEYGGERYIVSCSHGLKGVGDPILIIFNNGRTTAVADVVAMEPSILQHGPDCSISKLRDGKRVGDAFGVSPAPLAEGSVYYLSGFVDGRLRVRETRYEGLDEQGHAVFDGQAIPGESGGPINDQSGRLCGVIHSCVSEKDDFGRPNPAYMRGERLAFGCPLHYIQGLLDGVLPGRPGKILPRRDQMPWASTPQRQLPSPPPAYTPPIGGQSPPIGNPAPPFTPPSSQQPPTIPSPQQSPEQSAPPQSGAGPPLPPVDNGRFADPPPGNSFGQRIDGAVQNASSLPWWVSTGLATLGPVGGALGVAGWFIAWRLKKRLKDHFATASTSTASVTTAGGLGGPSSDGQFRVHSPVQSAA